MVRNYQDRNIRSLRTPFSLQIRVVPDNWFSSKEEVPYLFLSPNPWECSCSLGYLHTYLDMYETNFYVRDGPDINNDAESVVSSPTSDVCEA